MPATGPQIVAARALLQWKQADLAERSGVAVSTIKRLEAMSGPLTANRSTIGAILAALEAGGIVLLSDGETLDGGRGVRLRKDPQQEGNAE